MVRYLALILSALLCAAFAPATSVLHYTLDESVEAADLVVRGEVIAREYDVLTLSDDTAMPVVRYTVRVEHCYVGDETASEITLLNPGGPINGAAAHAGIPPGFPDHRVGEEVVLLLERREGRLASAQSETIHPSSFLLHPYFVPVGLAQGKYVVTRTEDGDAFASRAPIAARLIDRRTGEMVPPAEVQGIWKLEVLEAQIRAAVEAVEE